MKRPDTRNRPAAIGMLVALAACSGGGHSAVPAAPVQSGATPGGGSTTSSKLVSALHPSAAFTAATTPLGPATAVNTIVLHVVPALQNAAGLAQYAQHVSDPTSANYRHYITPAAIGNQYGATAADYAAVAGYFASYGLKVASWPQRLALTVGGPRSAMEKALGTTFALYRAKDGHTLLAPTGAVAFSKPIPVASLADAVVEPAARWINLVPSAGAPNQARLSGFAPQQLAAAFDFDSAYNAGFTGSGITIGIIGTGPAMAVDFTTYRTQYGLSGAGKLTFPPVLSANAAANANGSPLAPPPPVTGPCGTSSSPNFPPSESPGTNCNPEDFEAQIDTEQAALARDATVAFYLGYVPVECNTPGSNSCSPDPVTGLGYSYQGLAESDDEIQQIIADNTVDVVSGSYGGPEIFQNEGYVANFLGGYDPSALLPSEMAALAAEGIAAFFSSGDQGAQTCAPYSTSFGALTCVSEPASDVNVTAVGGVTIPLDNAGNLVGPITGWGQQTWFNGQGGASGGGVSCFYPAPPWQQQPTYESVAGPLLNSAGSTACAAGFSAPGGGGRLVPDVSLEGDPSTGVAVVANVAFGGGSQSVFGGTSVATPEMAAMWALVLQACAKTSSCAVATGAKPYRLGNAAPYFWKAYQTQATYASTIYDVTFGNNGEQPCVLNNSCSGPTPPPVTGYVAGTGWDAVTGLGVPFARHLITTVVGI